jgi:cellulose synthase/poly-beta-1,6-N-acetylglucosamine synthase-like glycosyltransferase
VLNAALLLMLQTLGLVLFFNRYIANVAVKILRRNVFEERDLTFEPTVTVVIPMFNEGAGIRATLESVLATDYPQEKLEIVVIDDCSTDDSYQHAQAVARRSGGRLRVLRNQKNMGKRRSINRAVMLSRAEIIVSVDSDVIVDKGAVRGLVVRFTKPEIAAVGGKVDIGNKHDNWLTKMQAVKYWYSYHSIKSLEWSFQRVACLSGCLTAYRRSVLVELHPILEHRSFCGVTIKYGEDRFLTRQIIKAGYLTTMTLDSVCWTQAPNKLNDYLSQQLRWRRSFIIDCFGGLTHMWRLNPIIGIHYFSLCMFVVAYPALLMSSIMKGTLFKLLTRQVVIAGILGVVYYFKAKKLKLEVVHPLSLIPAALVVPVLYALITPLAFFTLDSGSWETRDHDDATTADDRAVARGGVVEPVAGVNSAPIAVASTAAVTVATASAQVAQVASATGRFELPAA